MTHEPHTPDTKYRARVEDYEGDRWSVIGPLSFLDLHCADHRLRIVHLKELPHTNTGSGGSPN